MSETPSVSGKDAMRAFERLGFYLKRIKGSHHIMARDGHEYLLSIPIHRGKSLKKGTLLALIKASGFSVEEFVEALSS